MLDRASPLAPGNRRVRHLVPWALAVLLLGAWGAAARAGDGGGPYTAGHPMELRAEGVPNSVSGDPESIAKLKILEEFQRQNPAIKPVSATGLTLPNNLSMDMIPLMQIAGDIAPDVFALNFRQSDTFIRNRFLYPLDKYLEGALQISVPNGDLMSTDEYIAALKKSPLYKKLDLDNRIPRQLWDVIRRDCPYGDSCPYCEKWGEKAAAHHYHVWCIPGELNVRALTYRRDLFREAGLPDRVPATMDELYKWAKILTNPKEDRYGFALTGNDSTFHLGWSTLAFLYSNGGSLVKKMPDGHWVCSFDDEAAVDTYYFVARLFHEPFDNKYGHFTSVVSQGREGVTIKSAMSFSYLNERYFAISNPEQTGYGPVPTGEHGGRGSELNGDLLCIYGGLDNAPARRDAAWKYLLFLESPEARRIRAETYVENGAGRYLTSQMLRESGHPEYISQIPPGWEQSLQETIAHGIPEPYGENCQQVYLYVSQAVDQIRTDAVVTDAIGHFDEARAKARIREILRARVIHSNEKMLGIIPPDVQTFRRRVALAVVIGMMLAFGWLFYKVMQVFARNQMAAVGESSGAESFGGWGFPQRLFLRFMGYGGRPNVQATARPAKRQHWQFERYKLAYLLLFPAVGSIALWAYYPLAQGTVIAFEHYNVRGFSTWVGLDNFANVLFDDDFWFSLWVSLKYAALYMGFGFFAPIILAFLLTEVPRGKVLFRTIYYLPAVLSGAVVIFLWKGFYGRYGLINQFLNFFVCALNWIPGVHLADVHTAWLENPQTALLFCLIPTIWAGMGPGCLIYLAALKTVPDEFYEAAEIDGAGIYQKLRHVAIPGIRGLIAINFIGALIGTIQGGSEMILAMTTGGPYTPHGATEVVGLHIFWQAYGYLRFGAATSMAWILGSLLIGFTMMQLTRLSRMEFKTASSMGQAGS